jgi:preprotein translocase subunit SecD
VVEFEQRIGKSNGLSDLTLKVIVMLIMIVFMVRTHSLRKAREVKNIVEEAVRMMTPLGVDVGKGEDRKIRVEDGGKVEKGRRTRRKIEEKVEGVERKVEDKVEKVEGSLSLSDDVREYIVRMVTKRNYSKPRRRLENLGYRDVKIMKRRDKIIVEADGGREIIDVGKYMGDQKR